MPAATLQEGTRINTNGAGDAFTSGLLVASMLRHSGKVVTLEINESPLRQQPRETPEKKEEKMAKKTTPYTLYMKENYVMLKRECRGDKKAIFTMCHEMWENESEEVKAMYARMVKEEYEETSGETHTSVLSDTSMDALESKFSKDFSGVQFETETTANASLKLESAVQLAGLIAARHINISTRDLDHLDLTELLQKSIMSLSPVPTSEV
jgi:hypothetical protein